MRICGGNAVQICYLRFGSGFRIPEASRKESLLNDNWIRFKPWLATGGHSDGIRRNKFEYWPKITPRDDKERPDFSLTFRFSAFPRTNQKPGLFFFPIRYHNQVRFFFHIKTVNIKHVVPTHDMIFLFHQELLLNQLSWSRRDSMQPVSFVVRVILLAILWGSDHISLLSHMSHMWPACTQEGRFIFPLLWHQTSWYHWSVLKPATSNDLPPEMTPHIEHTALNDRD